MRPLRLIIRAFLLFFLFSLSFLVCQEFLRDKWTEGEYNPTDKIRGFYAMEEDSCDVVICGSSQAYADIAPAVLFRDYGIVSYDFCVNEQPLWLTYYYISEAIEKQHPKLIVLDVFTVFLDDYETEGVNHFSLDDFPMGLKKLRAIHDSVPQELRYSYVFPMAKYHTTWDELYEGKITESFRRDEDVNRGYSPFVFDADYEEGAKQEVRDQKECLAIPEKSRTWLLKIMDLCSKNHTELLLIKTPNGNAERQMLYNSVWELAKEQGVDYYDMNVLLDGQAHVNVLQAEKISGLLGEKLKTYGLKDRRSEEKTRKAWEETVSVFERNHSKNRLLAADNLNRYRSVLEDAGYVYASYSAGESRGKIGVGKTVLSEGEVMDGSTLETKAEDVTVTITENDGIALLFDGVDYSMKQDGINIAVYDPVLHEMVDMAAFSEDGTFLGRK